MSNELDALNISEEKKQYVLQQLNPLLEDMVMDALFAAPLDQDPVPYLLSWCYLRKQQSNAKEIAAENEDLKYQLQVCKESMEELKNAIITDSIEQEQDDETKADESEEESDDELIEEPEFLKKPAGAKMRTSVSAEAYGAWNVKKDFEAPVYPKNEGQKRRLAEVLNKSFLFSSLESNETAIVIDAMEEVTASAGERLIRLGDDGDFLFVIEKGSLECNKDIDGVSTVLKVVEEGDCFGELALLYNCPRAANVDAKVDCVLWKLGRESFNHIVKDAAAKKRERYEGFLDKVDLLQGMDAYQRSQVADGLKTESFSAGDTIMKQGEEGNKFYILEEGAAHALKDDQKVMSYSSGSFFGELALLRNQPRACSVVADSNCKCVVLERQGFRRLLGGSNELKKMKRITLSYDS